MSDELSGGTVKVLTPSEYFTKGGTGSNSRQWSKRYVAMYEKYETLKKLEGINSDLNLIIKGFEMAIETFESKGK